MNKRKPLEPIEIEQNTNFQITNEPIKQRGRTKSSGPLLNRQALTDPQVYLNDDDYSNYWNQYEMSKNLQKALDQTNIMNSQIEAELNRLSNIEDELNDQVTLNQQLYDLYVQYRDQES